MSKQKRVKAKTSWQAERDYKRKKAQMKKRVRAYRDKRKLSNK